MEAIAAATHDNDFEQDLGYSEDLRKGLRADIAKVGKRSIQSDRQLKTHGGPVLAGAGEFQIQLN